MPGAFSLSSPLPPGSTSRTLTFACGVPLPFSDRGALDALPLREAGARVAENVLLRDLYLDAPVLDDRRARRQTAAAPAVRGDLR